MGHVGDIGRGGGRRGFGEGTRIGPAPTADGSPSDPTGDGASGEGSGTGGEGGSPRTGERPALRTGPGGRAAVPLAVVRRGIRVDVFVAACSHLSGRLDEGAVESVRGADCLVCPLHGSAFDLDTGEPRRGPAANAQEKLEVRMSAGRVMARPLARNR